MSIFYKGDSIDIIKKQIKDKSIDLIYIDPPFGTTQNWWDSKMDWPVLFSQFFRVLKDTGMLVIHCSVPFSYHLINTAPKPPSYTWYWDKESCTNHLGSNYQPLRRVEEILVWKNKKTTYYRQQIGDEVRTYPRGNPSSYFGKVKTPGEPVTITGKTRSNLITMKRKVSGFSTRPNELVKLMIDSYSKPGDTILDCFCYKGLSYTQSTGRKWIGIDLNFIPNCLIDGNSG
jgi:DNA modification methylase